MRHSLLLLILFILPYISYGQWTEEEKGNFIKDCMQYAYNQGIREEAKLTCNCVLQKFLVKYPRAKDAAAHGSKHIAKYTLMCLPHEPGKWHPMVINQFQEVCLDYAKNNNQIRNQSTFCSCMQTHFQNKFPQDYMLNLSEKDKSLLMLEIGSDCLFEDSRQK